jgi:predicted DNA-binding transcriptional regulator AlpA
MVRRIDKRVADEGTRFEAFERFCDSRGWPYILSTPQLAEALGISAGSLRKQKSEGKTGSRSNLPEAIKRGRSVGYPRDSVKVWLASFTEGAW